MPRARAVPHVGDHVTVAFLAARVAGVVTHIDDSSLRIDVRTEEGETVHFALNRATGSFLADGQQSGARLLFGID
jgi:hypothetical protein